MKRVVPYVLWFVLAIPLTFVVTFICSPFWFETKTGIESFGHSGPSDWCFLFTYGVLVLAGTAGLHAARQS
jgi:hypothetical protein